MTEQLNRDIGGLEARIEALQKAQETRDKHQEEQRIQIAAAIKDLHSELRATLSELTRQTGAISAEVKELSQNLVLSRRDVEIMQQRQEEQERRLKEVEKRVDDLDTQREKERAVLEAEQKRQTRIAALIGTVLVVLGLVLGNWDKVQAVVHALFP